MTPFRLRAANPADAEAVALLHADSWRRHYRGAYSDAYLDGDVVADRLAVWSARLAAPSPADRTVLAEDDAGLAGFVHLVYDHDPRWGSLLDNLHVRHDRQGGGLGRTLFTTVAVAPMYLWVLEQNTAAQGFYRSLGGEFADTARVGNPERLAGEPRKLRVIWPASPATAVPAPAAPNRPAP